MVTYLNSLVLDGSDIRDYASSFFVLDDFSLYAQGGGVDDNLVYEYSLSNANDLSSGSYVDSGSSNDVRYVQDSFVDGYNILFLGENRDYDHFIQSYELPDYEDPLSLTFEIANDNLIGEKSFSNFEFRAVEVSQSGNYALMLRNDLNNDVSELKLYDMSTSWDPSTMSLVTTVDIFSKFNTTNTYPTGMELREDNSTIWFTDDAETQTVHKFNISNPFSSSISVTQDTSFAVPNTDEIQDVSPINDGEKIFVLGDGADYSKVDSYQVKPPSPSNLSISDSSAENEFTLDWDSVSNVNGYYVYRAQATGSTTSDYTQIADITSPPYTDTGLEDGEQYYYRVSSHD